MPKYIGNCLMDRTTSGIIDWNAFLSTIDKTTDVVSNCLLRHDNDIDDSLPNYWFDLIDAGYNWSNVKWTDYNLDGTHEVVKKFSKLVNSKFIRCFVSKVDPGIGVPMHQDHGDEEYTSKFDRNKMSRYTCFIKEPSFGQTFIVDKHCFYNEEKHKIVKWNNFQNFHATFNVGYESHYIFHFLGEDYSI